MVGAGCEQWCLSTSVQHLGEPLHCWRLSPSHAGVKVPVSLKEGFHSRGQHVALTLTLEAL